MVAADVLQPVAMAATLVAPARLLELAKELPEPYTEEGPGPEVLLMALLAGGATGVVFMLGDTDVQMSLASAAGAAVRRLDPELTHNIAVQACARGLMPVDDRPDPLSLSTEVFGLRFSNPVGLAAGFDKHAEAMQGLMGLGFGFVEIGSVTPQPQPGNPTPRVFRIPEARAIINRYGFNSLGADAVASNLEAFEQAAANSAGVKRGLLGVNLGKNKTSEDAAADYCEGLTKLGRFADYLVVNVSSPNTPGLRSLQGRNELKALVRKVQATRDSMAWGPRGAPPLLVKVAPDLSEDDKQDIAEVALGCKIDGLIVSNTTVSRPAEVSSNPVSTEAGGLSGAPLFPLATAALSDMYRLTQGRIPIVGAGGVSSGEDAYKKIRAGASLVQLYTAFAYGGPELVPAVKRDLAACLARDGFKSVREAVGADHPQIAKTLAAEANVAA
ncbi:hypothetical protein HYH03_011332 [Edaphochlamys debaryana]|uniref:Dihydroorotate dehydrogenase (quinone), mitochondrial n=1 Tax=Edaphochlamys debaryana TaxID=47281 RepID=A0A835Y0C0_9CHLO|nr:hypothetical protein HYH03_011332 [Edaphochlamys debaryana]|eukprot:KAG2490205.1 hypothetical protein HYH03_011332 [Edaphochlamys debaryana]